MISLQKALEPSSCAAALDGPKQRIPACVRASARPATSGASGPMTTRSTCSAVAAATIPSMSCTPTSITRASAAIPAFPGAQMISGCRGERASAWTSACSRPPPPTMRTRLESDCANEVVDRDRGQRLVFRGTARAELERDPRHRLLVGRLDDVHEIEVPERRPLCLDSGAKLLDL